MDAGRAVMGLDVDVRLTPGVRAPRQARRGLEALRPSLDDGLVDEAVLLVSEVVTNSVRHANLDARDAIVVRARGVDGGLRVEVTDPGAGFDRERIGRPDGRGGWGIWLLDRLSTRWGVDRDGVTTVWFELRPPVSGGSTGGTSNSTIGRRRSDG
jgi:anti-sigma regulatory factor (Ser/Thr protein kinase)